jgi:hypothetical protein
VTHGGKNNERNRENRETPADLPIGLRQVHDNRHDDASDAHKVAE